MIIELIPHHDGAMSIYTIVAFGALISGNVVAYTMLLRWVLQEFRRIDTKFASHDDYTNDTTSAINRMGTEMAVLNERMGNMEDAMSEMRKSVIAINQTLLDRLPGKSLK